MFQYMPEFLILTLPPQLLIPHSTPHYEATLKVV